MRKIGNGEFGIIYEGLKGAKAVRFLLRKKTGEIVGAFHHREIGEIDIFWGNEDIGLKKILQKHPEVINKMQKILNESKVVSKTFNRIKLESLDHKTVVRLDWNGQQKTWLLTMYEKSVTK
jgi:tryptophan 2,3-dioxygenase